MSFRRQLRQVQKKAAQMGIMEAYRFFDMTPYEVSLLLRSHGAQEKKALERLHLLSRLAALAVHAPRQLPPFPVFAPDEEMDWQQMKQRLLAWRRKDIP